MAAAVLCSLQVGTAGTLEITAQDSAGNNLPIVTVTNGSTKSQYMVLSGPQMTNSTLSISFTGNAYAVHGAVTNLSWNFGNNATPASANNASSETTPVNYAPFTSPQIVTCGVDHTDEDTNGNTIHCTVASKVVSKITLVNVSLKQLNYPTSMSATDMGTTQSKVIKANEISYITGIPEMPKLEISLGDGTIPGMTVEWKMAIKSERPDKRGTQDDKTYPSSGYTTLASEEPWKIYNEFNTDFIGGKATVYFKINGGSENTFEFKIRGKNPKDADAKTYIQSVQGNFMYAWAIAQHETRTPSGNVYNQFATTDGSSWGDKGQPFYSPVEGNGWGLFQRDATGGGLIVDTGQVYSWQVNTQVAIQELGQKWTIADRIFRYFRNKYGNQPGWEEPPQSYQISNSYFSAWDLATIILYNHATGCPPSTVKNDSGNSVNVTFPWTFDPNREPKWQFSDNDENYATSVIRNEWEGKLNKSE